MSRLRFLTMLGAAMLLSFLLVKVRYQAQEIEEEVAGIERQISDEHQDIRILNAEWSYLTRPEKLQELVVKYLGMQPTARAQLASWGDIPQQKPEPLADVSPAAGNPKLATNEAAEMKTAPVQKDKLPQKSIAKSVWDVVPEEKR